jgi:hypothetical protein
MKLNRLNYFDWEFYKNEYSDLKIIKNKRQALEHWTKHGKKERRCCNKYLKLYPDFNWKIYVSRYDDLKKISSEMDAFIHWITYGVDEGRYYQMKKFSSIIIQKNTYNIKPQPKPILKPPTKVVVKKVNKTKPQIYKTKLQKPKVIVQKIIRANGPPRPSFSRSRVKKTIPKPSSNPTISKPVVSRGIVPRGIVPRGIVPRGIVRRNRAVVNRGTPVASLPKKSITRRNALLRSNIKIIRAIKHTLVAIIPMLDRHAITRKSILALRCQTVKVHILLLVSNSKDEQFARANKVDYIKVKNSPLSMKVQAGITHAKRFNPEGVLICGSDDVLTETWVEEGMKYLRHYDLVGKRYHYVWDLNTNDKYLLTYKDNMSFLPKNLKGKYYIGSGRFISRRILHKAKWKLYTGANDSGIDLLATKKIHNLGGRFIEIASEKANIISLKKDWDSLNGINKMKQNPNITFVKIKNIPYMYDEVRTMFDDMLIVRKNKTILKLEDSYFKNVKYFNRLGIYQVRVSSGLKFFKDKIMKIYNLKEYSNKNKPALFFGLYNSEDVKHIKMHDGMRYLLWGGTDADMRYNKKKRREFIDRIKNYGDLMHFSSSKNLQQRLNNLGIPNRLLMISFCINDKQFMVPKKMGDSIYIYNGLVKGTEMKYGGEIYKTVMKKLPQYNYLLSNELSVPYRDMGKVYQQCFLGIRLTINDACAMTVQEMGLMGMPIIHNSDYPNAIKWKNANDVVSIIKSCDDKFKKNNYRPKIMREKMLKYLGARNIIIVIYTYKRPHFLNNLLYMIYNNIIPESIKLTIKIYDDGTPYSYPLNTHGMNVNYHKFKNNHGKQNWYKFINFIYNDMKSEVFDYVIFFTDDIIINYNFVETALKYYDSIKDPLKVTMTLSNDRECSWTNFKQQKHNDYVNLCQWTEMNFVCDKQFFEALNYSLTNFETTKLMSSSGVPGFISKSLFDLKYNMYVPRQSLILVADINSSIMNNSKKGRTEPLERLKEYYE